MLLLGVRRIRQQVSSDTKIQSRKKCGSVKNRGCNNKLGNGFKGMRVFEGNLEEHS